MVQDHFGAAVSASLDQIVGFRVQRSGFRVSGLECRVHGLGFTFVLGLALGCNGFEFIGLRSLNLLWVLSREMFRVCVAGETFFGANSMPFRSTLNS